MPIPFRFLSRRAGPVGLVLSAFDAWKRLPPKQRRKLLDVTRKHGPRLAAQAVKRARKARLKP